jgi:hypothetical protein
VAYFIQVNAQEGQLDEVPGNWDGVYGPSMMGNWNAQDSINMMSSSMMGEQNSQYRADMMNGGMMDMVMNGDIMNDNMMNGFGAAPGVEISVTADEAMEIAQQYLDEYLPGSTVDQADTFPGYYTLHMEQNGEIIGMLSVNAYTDQVFLHHWHGDFIEINGNDHN